MSAWYVDSWDVLDGHLFASRRSPLSEAIPGEIETTVFICAPYFDAQAVLSPATAWAATRGASQLGFFIDKAEVEFDSLEQIQELARRGFNGGGGGDLTPGGEPEGGGPSDSGPSERTLRPDGPGPGPYQGGFEFEMDWPRMKNALVECSFQGRREHLASALTLPAAEFMRIVNRGYREMRYEPPFPEPERHSPEVVRDLGLPYMPFGGTVPWVRTFSDLLAVISCDWLSVRDHTSAHDLVLMQLLAALVTGPSLNANTLRSDLSTEVGAARWAGRSAAWLAGEFALPGLPAAAERAIHEMMTGRAAPSRNRSNLGGSGAR